MAKIIAGKIKSIELGNLSAKRDWGFSGDYVEAMHLIMNYKKADDYVVATGKTYSIRQFIKITCGMLGIKPVFEGKGLNEICYDKKNGKKIIIIDKKYFRTQDVHRLKGNSYKIKTAPSRLQS